jgi:hypothetical protein
MSRRQNFKREPKSNKWSKQNLINYSNQCKIILVRINNKKLITMKKKKLHKMRQQHKFKVKFSHHNCLTKFWLWAPFSLQELFLDNLKMKSNNQIMMMILMMSWHQKKFVEKSLSLFWNGEYFLRSIWESWKSPFIFRFDPKRSLLLSRWVIRKI